MKFTPDYGVIYHGVRYPANIPFEINDMDAEEMKRHGKIETVKAKEPPKPTEPKQELEQEPEQETETEKKPAPKGRPKKES